MNISFNGLKHITGPKEKVKQHLLQDATKYTQNPIAINIKGDTTDVFILTGEDVVNYTEQYFVKMPQESLEEGYKTGLSIAKNIKSLLTNKKLIQEYFFQQKEKGAEIEEIKL